MQAYNLKMKSNASTMFERMPFNTNIYYQFLMILRVQYIFIVFYIISQII